MSVFISAEGLNKWYYWIIMPTGVVGNIISFVVRENLLQLQKLVPCTIEPQLLQNIQTKDQRV